MHGALQTSMMETGRFIKSYMQCGRYLMNHLQGEKLVSASSRIRSHNHFVHQQKLHHLAKLVVIFFQIAPQPFSQTGSDIFPLHFYKTRWIEDEPVAA